MFLHEIAGELKPYFEPRVRDGQFLWDLVDELLRPPMTDEEQKLFDDEDYNPVSVNMSLNMADQIFRGQNNKWISKARAGTVCSRYDGQRIAEHVDGLYDQDKEHLQNFLLSHRMRVNTEDLGSAVSDIFEQLFHGLAKGIHDVDIRLTIYDKKPTIRELAEDRVYCQDGKLFIDGSVIELPIKLDESQIYDFEKPYLTALCNAYADALSRDDVSLDDIPDIPKVYQRNFSDQRKAYISAESIQRSISEVYEDGKNQFDVLKQDEFDGISPTYFDDEYQNGYRRLVAVLKKVPEISLSKSKLSLIKNLIGNLERLGIVHILVNDGTIKSWVDPYEE